MLFLLQTLYPLGHKQLLAKVSKLQYTIAQDQEETADIADRVNGTGPVQAIGFAVPNEYEVEYE